MKQKLWGGAFSKELDPFAWKFGQSIDSDAILWKEEIQVSIAHARMLGSTGIIPGNEAERLVDALERIYSRVSDELGSFTETIGATYRTESSAQAFQRLAPDAEDIHAAIESMLQQEVGELAGKLHAGRSRNDQIATVTRLWLRLACQDMREHIANLQGSIIHLAEQHKTDPMPGFTHMQSAQPVTLGFHLLAYFWMLQRDVVRFEQLKIAESPLGSAALAGTSLPIDRVQTAKALGFPGPMPNALDATSDRDFVGDALHACATLMQHLSRLSQELILWSTPMYGFVKLDEAFTTGSSIMPQKRNPDMAELIRGRSARAIGHWVSFMTMMKALPLGYNRDQQEDKPGLFDSFKLCQESLYLCDGMLENAKFDTQRMVTVAGDGFATATGIADALVKEGLPFRKAHEETGRLVRTCEEKGLRLDQLTGTDLGGLPESVLAVTSVEASITSRSSYGGPATQPMDVQIREALQALNATVWPHGGGEVPALRINKENQK